MLIQANNLHIGINIYLVELGSITYPLHIFERNTIGTQVKAISPAVEALREFIYLLDKAPFYSIREIFKKCTKLHLQLRYSPREGIINSRFKNLSRSRCSGATIARLRGKTTNGPVPEI